jgi:hypothetical protein
MDLTALDVLVAVVDGVVAIDVLVVDGESVEEGRRADAVAEARRRGRIPLRALRSRVVAKAFPISFAIACERLRCFSLPPIARAGRPLSLAPAIARRRARDVCRVPFSLSRRRRPGFALVADTTEPFADRQSALSFGPLAYRLAVAVTVTKPNRLAISGAFFPVPLAIAPVAVVQGGTR